MTDAPATIATPADISRANIAKQSADATAQLAQMTKDYQSSAGARVEQLRAQLAALDADGHFLGAELVSHGARSQRSALQSQLAAAEAEAATEIQQAFSPVQRVDLAIEGKVDLLGIETTVNDQIPARDFTAAVQDDLQLGLREDLVRTFHATGKTDDPMGHVAAQSTMTPGCSKAWPLATIVALNLGGSFCRSSGRLNQNIFC